jgi:hypothetical protein
MSNILYYSKYCEHSKKLLAYVTSNSLQKQMHFICIDKRVKDPTTNKLYIVMDNGERIIMPENVQSVPAMLLLKDNYRVIYGDEIYNYVKPVVVEQVKQGTQNNMEPTCFSFHGENGGLGGVMSDNFSFLDQSADEMGTKGQGGMRQMYNYAGLNGLEESNSSIQTPKDDFTYEQSGQAGNQSSSQGMTLEQLQQMRDDDFRKTVGGGQGI